MGWNPGKLNPNIVMPAGPSDPDVGLGYRWVDLSCLSWASHVSVPKLMEDFDTEATRVETALTVSGLKVANLTFDDVIRPTVRTIREGIPKGRRETRGPTQDGTDQPDGPVEQDRP